MGAVAAIDRIEAWFRLVLGWAGMGPWRGAALAGIVTLFAVLPGLATLPVTDRDEARFAQASKQMIETGDLIDIRFQDEPRWKKPVGIYWLQAGSASLLGGTGAPIWAYRLPSAIAVVLAAMATVWAARPLLPAPAAALSGIMLGTAVLAAAEANIAKTDATLMLTAVVALGALARVLTGTAGRWTWLAFWLAMAGAVLLKGPVAPGIALLTLAGTVITRRSLPPLGALRPLPGLVLLAALVLPWLSAIWTISEGRFFADSIGNDLLGKVAEGQEKHWGPPGLYTAIVWGTFWPWAALLPAALAWGWRERRSATVLILAAWVIPFWVVLELVPTKLPHYVLPLYPALAMLVAAWAMRAEAALEGGWMRRLAAVLVALPGVVLGLAAFTLPLALEGRVVAGALAFGLAGAGFAVLAAAAALRGRIAGLAGAGLISALAIYPAVLQFGLPALATAFPSPRLAALAEPWRACASGPLVSVGYREPSLVFLAGTGTALLHPEAAAERAAADPGALLLVEGRQRPALDAALGTEGPELVARGALSYFNYNRGKRESATLLTPADPRWEPCAARAAR